MKNKIDLYPETHRKASDCTCYVCTKDETKQFKKSQNVFSESKSESESESKKERNNSQT